MTLVMSDPAGLRWGDSPDAEAWSIYLKQYGLLFWAGWRGFEA